MALFEVLESGICGICISCGEKIIRRATERDGMCLDCECLMNL